MAQEQEKDLKEKDNNKKEAESTQGEKEAQKEKAEQEKPEDKKKPEKKQEELSPLEKALDDKAKLADQLLRTMAEFDNYRKRVRKEKAELILNGAEKTITAILPIMDDMERAMANAGKTDDPKNRKSEPANDANGNDWKSVDYQMVTVSGSPVTGKWSTCKSFGVPPCSPWGNIFYTASSYGNACITRRKFDDNVYG